MEKKGYLWPGGGVPILPGVISTKNKVLLHRVVPAATEATLAAGA